MNEAESETSSGTLAGRTVLVTGGNGGIGLGIAKGCAAAGADVVIWGTSSGKLASAAGTLDELGPSVSVLPQQVDVRDEGAVSTAFGEAVDSMGKVDAVFANAGVSSKPVPFADQTIEQWRALFEVNVEGLFFTLREGAKHMIERGEGGSLVGVSSVSAIHGAPASQPYAASKAAVLSIVRGLAVELARHKIRCNSIVPGWTETEMTEAGRQHERFLANTTARTPIRRWGLPDDFGAVGAFLADPAQVYHTGDEIIMDGGYTRF